MAIDSRIALNLKPINVGERFAQNIQNLRNTDILNQQRDIAPIQLEQAQRANELAAAQQPALLQQAEFAATPESQAANRIDVIKRITNDYATGLHQALSTNNPEQVKQFIQGKIQSYRSQKISDDILRSIQGDIAQLDTPTGMQELLAEATTVLTPQSGNISLAQKEFNNLTELAQGDPDSDITKAARIKLRLDPGAVGSSTQTVAADKGLTQQVADSKAKIKQAEKFAELTATSRGKAIETGSEQRAKIDLGLSNIDAAIQAVNDGAGTGFINKNFPSIKAASVLLDNIQGRMALDVIGAVTFGALSKGELDLAKMIALPTGLKGPELIKHLQDKKAAQEKLKNYYGEQIEFLDQGGSVAGFLRSKKREALSVAPEQPDKPEQQQISEGQTATGPNGQKAIFTNGQWVVK